MCLIHSIGGAFKRNHGVKVIVAHCARLGTNEDLDSKDRQQRDNFDLASIFMINPSRSV